MLTAREDQLPGRVSVPRGTVPAGRRRGTARAPRWFVVPAMLLFAFVVLVPSARGVYYAFADWDGLDPAFSFVGMADFVDEPAEVLMPAAAGAGYGINAKVQQTLLTGLQEIFSGQSTPDKLFAAMDADYRAGA